MAGKFEYDLFVSHASEDKDTLVRPLAEALRREGLRVWYDEFRLSGGDSLTKGINFGLAQSRFGLVILSEHFFNKQWPQDELGALWARRTPDGLPLLLPIWHGVDKRYLLEG